MKFSEEQFELDGIDLHILDLLQGHGKMHLAKIGEQVGLSAPAVIERIKKLEDSGIIKGYTAILDARKLGLDIAAFIGVSIDHPKRIPGIEAELDGLAGVMECHHVTGSHSLWLKVKTRNTSSLEELISRIRSLDGVARTETMVVLSTHTEKTQIALAVESPVGSKRVRRNGEKPANHA